MGAMWLIWDGCGATARIREEVRLRCPDARIVCVDDVDALIELAGGLGGARVALGAGPGGASDLARVIRAVRSGSTGCAAPMVLAYIDGMDAGFVPELFDAGAREVIATGASRAGDARARGHDAEAAHMDIGTEVAVCNTGVPERGGLVSDEPSASSGGKGDEVPPWSTGVWDALDEPEDGVICPDVGTAGQTGEIVDLGDVARRARERGTADREGPHAPAVAVVSGQGGAGKTTLVAAMAACAARAGLRAAVIDADLMFGDLPSVLGVDVFRGLEGIEAHSTDDGLAEEDVESCAMRVGPGLTLWGPLVEPERAELYGAPVERLIAVLRTVADVIFIDTSTHWGDAVAAAVALCDRCLIVGGAGPNAGAQATRVVGLATRLGVPATRMMSVFNCLGAPGCMEEDALRFEMGASLGSRARVSFGGDEVSGLIGFGRLDSLMSGAGPFARDVRDLTGRMLTELGCSFDERLMGPAPEDRGRAPRFKLPWRRGVGDRR